MYTYIEEQPPVKNNPFKAPTRSHQKSYRDICEHLVSVHGSYEKLAQVLYKETGNAFSGNTVRRWFLDQTTPLKVVVALAIISDAEDIVGGMLPVLSPYLSFQAKYPHEGSSHVA
jgi:hypothetical protein